MNDLSLAGDFPAASEADWLKLVEKALGGAPFDGLRTPLHEGLKTEPLYTKQSKTPSLFGARGSRVVQPLAGRTLDEVHAQFEDDLVNGAEAFLLDFGRDLGVQTYDGLKYLLASDVAYYLAPEASVADAALVLAAASANGEPAKVRGSAGLDPLSVFALAGEMPADRPPMFANEVDATFFIRERCPVFVPFLASDRAWHGAGGSAVQELAFTLAAAVAYWRALAEAGMPLKESFACIGFSLTASADIFLTIAKFRAARLLWGRAVSAAGEEPLGNLLLLAEMSPRMITAYEPHANLLRGTAAAFGAAIGGTAAIHVLPFDEAQSGATAFSRRLARNTGLVLQHESRLSAVADAAAGSAYVETLTHELAASAWTLFRKVEAEGGLAAALESGFIRERLLTTSKRRQRAVAHLDDKITGVSVFPNLEDKVPLTVQLQKWRTETAPARNSDLALPPPGKGERFAALLDAAQRGEALSDLRSASRNVTDIIAPPLAVKRDAKPFENLRQRVDVAVAAMGSRPPVFLATLGQPSDYRARANYAQAFFAAGGIEAIVPQESFASVEALGAAFKRSPAPIACLCSSERVYASMAGAASALKTAGAVKVYLAGQAPLLKGLSPKDRAAVDRIIYEGCNALALLEEAQSILRVQELANAADLVAEEEGLIAEISPEG